MILVGSKAFENVGGCKFVDTSEVDNPELEQLDFAPVNLPPQFIHAHLPDLCGRAVTVVGNGDVSNYGPIIDRCDCVIRINSMYSWKNDPDHDGQKVTLWAGLPAFAVAPLRATPSQWTNSHFGRIAPTLEMIWCVSPYQCSARAYRWLRDNGLLPKFSSISDPFSLLDNYIDRLPAALAAELFSMPVLFNGKTGITNFELLLTGVKIALLVYLAGADEIHLCGFDFFQSQEERMWAGHDRAFNMRVIRFVRDAYLQEGRRFSWREQSLLDPTMGA
jgi:hypothetical protein